MDYDPPSTIIASSTVMKPNKHDRYVIELCRKIRDSYDRLILNYKISKNKRMLGEVDVCAIKDDKMDLFEVKCSFRIHKAEKQLRRAHRLLQTHGELFFYCGSSGALQPITCETKIRN